MAWQKTAVNAVFSHERQRRQAEYVLERNRSTWGKLAGQTSHSSGQRERKKPLIDRKLKKTIVINPKLKVVCYSLLNSRSNCPLAKDLKFYNLVAGLSTSSITGTVIDLILSLH